MACSDTAVCSMLGYLHAACLDTVARSSMLGYCYARIRIRACGMPGYCCVRQHARVLLHAACPDTAARGILGYCCRRHVPGYLRTACSDTVAHSMLGYCCVQHARILACGMPGYSCAQHHARIQLRAACPDTVARGSMPGHCCVRQHARILLRTDTHRCPTHCCGESHRFNKIAHHLCRTCERQVPGRKRAGERRKGAHICGGRVGTASGAHGRNVSLRGEAGSAECREGKDRRDGRGMGDVLSAARGGCAREGMCASGRGGVRLTSCASVPDHRRDLLCPRRGQEPGSLSRASCREAARQELAPSFEAPGRLAMLLLSIPERTRTGHANRCPINGRAW